MYRTRIFRSGVCRDKRRAEGGGACQSHKSTDWKCTNGKGDTLPLSHTDTHTEGSKQHRCDGLRTARNGQLKAGRLAPLLLALQSNGLAACENRPGLNFQTDVRLSLPCKPQTFSGLLNYGCFSFSLKACPSPTQHASFKNRHSSSSTRQPLETTLIIDGKFVY